MTEQNALYTPVRVSARDIPPPPTISAAARKILSDGTALPRMTWPPASEKDAWRKQLAAGTAAREQMALSILAGATAKIETTRIGGVLCYDCMPSDHTLE